jgi:hypothetical protein
VIRSIIGSSLRFRPLVIGCAAAALLFVLSACAGANPDRATGGSNPKPEQATAKDSTPTDSTNRPTSTTNGFLRSQGRSLSTRGLLSTTMADASPAAW